MMYRKGLNVAMCLEIRKLSIDNGRDIYEMLQELPADENGFINSVKGKTFDEYKEWLKNSLRNSEQTGLVNGWKVPEITFWLFKNNNPVGFGKVRHFLTEALLENGGNVGYAIRPSARNRGLGKKFLALYVALTNGGVIEKITANKHYIWIYL